MGGREGGRRELQFQLRLGMAACAVHAALGARPGIITVAVVPAVYATVMASHAVYLVQPNPHATSTALGGVHATLAMPVCRLVRSGQRVGWYLSDRYSGQTGLCPQHHALHPPLHPASCTVGPAAASGRLPHSSVSYRPQASCAAPGPRWPLMPLPHHPAFLVPAPPPKPWVMAPPHDT